ncbi:hypothetical protein ACCD06_28465 [Azospirillum sp. CT11-132]|uniref:hypothetical protein n=1 Tax=Azospirillum sp. CT11-132 TaxID=3396317 RepID=UPI0039A5798B
MVMIPSDAPNERLHEIHEKIKFVLSKEKFSIISLRGMGGLTGAPGGIWHDFENDDWNIFDKVILSGNIEKADIIIMNIGGENFEGLRGYLERRGFRGVLCFWLHDNHVAHQANKSSIVEGDMYFSSHYGAEHEDYLLNERSIAAPILPACYRNIPLKTVNDIMGRYEDFPRISKAVAPYFLYDPFPRTKFLKEIVRNSSEIVCFYTDSSEREEKYYVKLSEEEKAIRWFSFKSSIVVPLNMDMSIRIFDGLMWGHTVIVPDHLPAFDHVIDPKTAERLGVIRYSMSQGVEAINEAVAKAIYAFDQGGAEAVMERHNFVVSNHLYAHRVRALLTFLMNFANGSTVNSFVRTHSGWGMRTRYADRRPLI